MAMIHQQIACIAFSNGRGRAIELSLTFKALLMLLISLSGCGYKSGLERVHVSGQASYLGKPIEVGQIRFVPIEPTRAPITIESIRDGRYETETSGGVPIGNFRVELRMYDPVEYRTAPRSPMSPAIKQLLPNKYNRDSELTITIDSGSGSMEKDFLLTE